MTKQDALRRVAANQPLIGRCGEAAGQSLIDEGLATSRARSDSGAAWWLDLTDTGVKAARGYGQDH